MLPAVRHSDGLHDWDMAGVVRSLAGDKEVITAYSTTNFRDRFVQGAYILIDLEARRTWWGLGRRLQMRKALHHLTYARLAIAQGAAFGTGAHASSWVNALEHQVGAMFRLTECGCPVCASLRRSIHRG